MAGRGFQKIGSLDDAKELRKLNDQLYLLWYKVLGRIEGKDIDTEKFSLELSFVEGGTMSVGGSAGGVIQIKDASGVSIGGMNKDGIWIDEDKLAIRNKGDHDFCLIGERNFCGDHSFEYVAHDGAENGTHHDFGMTAPVAGNDRWEIMGGSPRVLDDAVCSDISQRYAWFGDKAAVCNSDNRICYTTRVDAARNTYTVSVHAWPHYSRNTGNALIRARMGIIWLGADNQPIGEQVLMTQELAGRFSPGTSGRIYHGCRFSTAVERPDTARYMKIRLLSPTASEWVCYDGMQVASGDRMLVYQPEDGLWHNR